MVQREFFWCWSRWINVEVMQHYLRKVIPNQCDQIELLFKGHCVRLFYSDYAILKTISFTEKIAMATFGSSLGKFGLLFILPSGHTVPKLVFCAQKLEVSFGVTFYSNLSLELQQKGS